MENNTTYEVTVTEYITDKPVFTSAKTNARGLMDILRRYGGMNDVEIENYLRMAGIDGGNSRIGKALTDGMYVIAAYILNETESDVVEMTTLTDAVDELTTALLHTGEYLRPDILPRVKGWSWWDALVKYAPDKADSLFSSEEPNEDLEEASEPFMNYEVLVVDEKVNIPIIEHACVNSTGMNAILKLFLGLNQHHRGIFMNTLIDKGHNEHIGKDTDSLPYTVSATRIGLPVG